MSKSEYNDDIAAEICSRLAQGQSLRTVCKAEDMPSRVTVFRWLRLFPEFVKLYTVAKEESADALTEELLDIADDSSNDWVEINRADGTTYRQLDKECVNRSRLRVDTRKWIASKMKPKKYGDSTSITGAGGGAIEVTTRLIIGE